MYSLKNRFLTLLTAALTLSTASAAEAPSKQPIAKKPRPSGTKWDLMDVGPFFSSGIEATDRVLKSVAIKLSDESPASVSFDTQLMRMAFGWTEGFLKLPVGREGLEGIPEMVGARAFGTPVAPGWSLDDQFKDPRPTVFESLPKSMARWRGLYLYGDEVVLSYEINGSGVLELPAFNDENDLPIFTRIFEIDPTSQPLNLLLCEDTNALGSSAGNPAALHTTQSTAANSFCVAAGLLGKVKDAKIEVINGKRLVLKLPKLPKKTTFAVSIFKGSTLDLDRFSQLVNSKAKLPDISKFCKGGPKRWAQPVITQGTLGTGDGPYVVDTLTLPDDNPWKSWIRCSGFDFFKDGRAAVCSVSGDVWIVSGIDDSLQKLTWQRYATGLFQPLGLKIVNDLVYVLGRDQITRLHDLNKDGEADFYENFNNDVQITSHYHEFCLNLETDSSGNFYFTKGGNLDEAQLPHHGTLLKVSKDGKTLEVVATGLRAPNGMGMGPNDEITISDNEGNWVPGSRVSLIKPGGFYGHVFTAHRNPKPTDHDKPIFWLPHGIDNSSGGQVWVTSDQWGPLKGRMLHMSYGSCSLFVTSMEDVNGQSQGAAVKLPLRFDSGVMRGRFHAKDGQLYVCGLRVWQSSGAKDGAFHRVRYTGKPVRLPASVQVKPNGLQISFTTALDPKAAVDPQNYAVEQWNYRWTTNYGSKEYSVANPEKVAHDPVEVRSIKLSSDNRSVLLEMDNLKPVMQMRVRFNLQSDDGAPVSGEFYNTINKVP